VLSDSPQLIYFGFWIGNFRLQFHFKTNDGFVVCGISLNHLPIIAVVVSKQGTKSAKNKPALHSEVKQVHRICRTPRAWDSLQKMARAKTRRVSKLVETWARDCEGNFSYPCRVSALIQITYEHQFIQFLDAHTLLLPGIPCYLGLSPTRRIFAPSCCNFRSIRS
jgi:hypothetical protein